MRVAPGHRAEDRLDRIMTTAARPKAIGLRFEPCLPLRLQSTEDKSLQGPVRDDGNPERALTSAGLRYEHPPDRLRFPRPGPVLHPVGQLGLLGSKQHGLAVDPGRLAARVDLRHPPHAHQSVRAGTEHELLQIPDLGQVSCLRCREDTLPQTPYVILGPLPVDRPPAGDVVLRSVHHEVSNLPFGSGPVSFGSSQAHLATSAPFRVRAAARIRLVIQGRAAKDPPMVSPVSRCLSAASIRFLAILFPPGDRPSSRSAHRPCRAGSRRGFHVPHN